MSQTYTVLSPWAKSDYLVKYPITPRLSDLAGKTIGLYASFKEYHPFFMQELERQLAAVLPETKFSHYTYIVDTKEIRDDETNYPIFQEWLSGVDAVIGVGADMGSCALYMGYNFAEIERLGKPAVLLSKYQYLSSASKGAGARSYPSLRIVTYDGPGFVPNGVDCNAWTIETYRDTIANMLDRIITALTAPLTAEEQNPAPAKDWSAETFTGTLDEINAWMYTHGFTNGTPVVPPTAEAVENMLRGTELARDTVVAELPPLMGQATVEKIAINGVMAGCLRGAFCAIDLADAHSHVSRHQLKRETAEDAGGAHFHHPIGHLPEAGRRAGAGMDGDDALGTHGLVYEQGKVAGGGHLARRIEPKAVGRGQADQVVLGRRVAL